MTEARKCAGVRKDGSPCAALVQPPATLCWGHSPQNAAQRSENASRAATAKARKPAAAEVADLKAKLRQLAQDVEDGNLETGKASVASQIYATLIKLLEFERKAKETQQLEERLAELEELAAEDRARGVRY